MTVHLSGRLSFLTAGERRQAEAGLSAAYEAGLPEDGVSIDGLLLVFDAQVAEERHQGVEMALRAVAHGAWGGRIRCHVEGPEADVLLFAGGPSARGVRPRGSVRPMTIASRWRAERARLELPAPEAYRFARADCTVLVFYALSASHDRPDDDDPRFIYGTPPQGVGVLGAMPAPNSRIVTRDDFFMGLHHAIGGEAQGGTLDAWAAVHLGESLSWAVETGCRWFGYMLEPPAIAGDGSAERRGIEAAAMPAPGPAKGAATMAATPARPSAPTSGATPARPSAPTGAASAARPAASPGAATPARPSAPTGAASATPAQPVIPSTRVSTGIDVPVAKPAPRPRASAPTAGATSPRPAPAPRPAAPTSSDWGAGVVPTPTSSSAASPPQPSAGGYQPRAAMGGSAGDRSSIYKALARNIGETSEDVARRVAKHVMAVADRDAALDALVAIANDGGARSDLRGDAVVALAMLGGYYALELPELAFKPLLDGALRLEAMNQQRVAGFRALLDVAPRRHPYDNLRGKL